MIQELFINGELVDLGPKNRVILNRDYIDLQNPDARISDASLRLKLPKSKKNNIVFSHINAENVKDKFVRIEDFDAILRIDGVIVHNGIFRILSVEEDGYTGVLLSGVANWSKLLTGKTLRDLKNDDLVTPWSVPFIGWDTNATQYSLQWYINENDYINSDVTFPLISYGTFYSSFISQNKIDEIHNDSLSMDNFPPAVYDLKIIKRIFQNIGWNVNSSLFSDSEAQKVFVPFTSADKVQWNFGNLFGGYASGSTMLMVADGGFTKANIKSLITFDQAKVNEKTTNILYLKYPTFIDNPQNSFQNFNINGGSGFFTGQSYDTKITTNYSFDFEIKNWRIDFEGRNKIRWNIPASGPTTVCPLSPFATQIGRATNPDVSLLRAGFCIYIDNPDNTNLNDILENINRYVHNYYYDTTNLDLQIDHPNILAAYVPTNSGVTNNYFFPYDPDANIVVTGNTDFVYFFPYSTTSPGGGGPVTITQDRFFSWGFSGNTRFEFRDIKLPAGYEIKAFVFGSGNRGTFGGSVTMQSSTCAGLTVPPNVDVERELEYGFSASSIDFRFLGNSDNQDEDLSIVRNLPDIGQLEYVKSWINRHSLFIDTDPANRVVTFEPYDSFYLPNDFYYDLSGKFNDNFFEPKSEPVVLPKVIQFYYNNDQSDALIGPDSGYGSIRIQNDNVYCEGSKDITNLFSATKTRKFTYNQSATSQLSFDIPSIADIDRFSFADLASVEINYANSNRILKLTGDYLRTSTGSIANLPVLDSNLKILLSVFEDDKVDKINLSYEGDYGLYNKYFERYLNEISDSYIITMDCRLTPTDFAALRPNVPVLINGQMYIVQRIRNYDPTNNGKCTISFIRKYTN